MPKKIALLGYGCVGQGVADLIAKYPQALLVDIASVVVQDVHKPREITPPVALSTDPRVALDDDVFVVVEVNGEVSDNLKLLTQAMLAGKHVVTANKELLSLHLEQLSRTAADSRVQLRFEAAVAGGVPVISQLLALRQHQNISKICGIVNGSVNFLLSSLQRGKQKSEVLAEAFELGYLEADPSADLDGFDAQRKLRILASLAFRGTVLENNVKTISVANIDRVDVEFMQQHQRVIKQVATAQCFDNCVSTLVAPQALPVTHLLAHVDGAYNCVNLDCDTLGPITLSGLGAGRYPTASAVVSDIADICAHRFWDTQPGPQDLTDITAQGKRRWYVRDGASQTITAPLPLDQVSGDVVVAWD